MEHKIKNAILSSIIAASLLAKPVPALAQVSTLPDGSVVNTTTDTSQFNASDLLWLIPLLAIPILAYYIFARRNNDTAEMERSQAYYGVKGGRAKRDSDESSVDEEV